MKINMKTEDLQRHTTSLLRNVSNQLLVAPIHLFSLNFRRFSTTSSPHTAADVKGTCLQKKSQDTNLNHKINQFMLVHLLRMKVCDQERDVIAHNRLAAKHNEVFCSHHHKSHKLFAKNFFNCVCLHAIN